MTNFNPPAREGSTFSAPATASELPRDRYDRPLISPPDGSAPVAYTRVTTLAKSIENTYHLGQWMNRMVALGMSKRKDLVLAASAISNPDDRGQKRTLQDIADRAKDSAAPSAASIGTALHSFTERADRGEDLSGLPEEYVQDIAAYSEATRVFSVHSIETFVVNDEYRVGGTYDRIYIVNEDTTVPEALGARLMERHDTDELAANGLRVSDDGLSLYIAAGTPVVGDVKGLALDTPIPTPSGWSTMGEIKVGDMVLGPNGSPVRVTIKSEVKHLPSFRVTFDDGSTIVCDDEHLWETTVRGKRAVRPIREIAATLRGSSGQLQHQIRVPEPLQFGTSPDLPMPPYTLGVWLGDGRTSNAEFCGHPDDIEIKERVEAEGVVVTTHANSGPSLNYYGLPGLREGLRQAGVLGNKRIPAVYLRASLSDRLALLQGIMDTDGTLNQARGMEVSVGFTNEMLRDDVAELARSLGEKVHTSQHRGHGFGKDVVVYTAKWTPRRFVPFALSRKAKRVRLRDTGRNSRFLITGVEEIESVPTACIAVDSADHLYLAGERWTPTHNTGKSVDLGAGSFAIQLGTYANSVVYNHESGSRHPHPGGMCRLLGVIVHVPAGKGTASIHWLDIGAGWSMAPVCAAVREWQSERGLIAQATTVTASPSTPTIAAQIAESGTVEALAAVYWRNKDAWTPGLNSLAAARKAAILEAGS